MVPPTELIRPQGGGRRRSGDREALAAIIFMATSGCTWRQLPQVLGRPTVYRRFAQCSQERVWARLHHMILDKLGARGKLTGRGARSTRSVCGPQKGAADGTEPDRPRQAGSTSVTRR
ncbi:hypothetical protein GCM10019016_137290 [Streptomyces prasinosporus]|uniref:Insertion element IS402-like domain-containing protein n=1 Tax=Streptomyces prasinosporus TaxID=68256 RepID=A0ABP6UJF3_9ACTN|nr:hypothetical protein GCM10010332_00230 [Streptomyces albogriseolus]